MKFEKKKQDKLHQQQIELIKIPITSQLSIRVAAEQSLLFTRFRIVTLNCYGLITAQHEVSDQIKSVSWSSMDDYKLILSLPKAPH